jgi:hypothetical protein
MRLKLLMVPVMTAAFAVAGMSAASAGEVNGNGDPTQGPAHANSICAFSGLQDGDDDDDGIPELPHGPGVPPQNWGHEQQAARAEGATPADLKASGFQPGDSCNGHRGFLAGGGGE